MNLQKRILALAAILLALAVGTVWLKAQSPGATPAIGAVTVSPSIVAVNTPAVVTVTASITDPRLIPSSVNLLRINATGTAPTILGQMHDDGLNGDVNANDGLSTLRVPLTEAGAGRVQLQVSAAFKGQLKRILSPVFNVSIWQTVSDPEVGVSFIYPPDWTLHSFQGSYIISSVTTFPSQQESVGNEIEITVLALDGFTEIQAWLNHYFGDEVDFSSKPINYYTNPYGLRFALVNGLPGMSSDNIHGFAIKNGNVIEVSVTPASSFKSRFDTILANMKPN